LNITKKISSTAFIAAAIIFFPKIIIAQDNTAIPDLFKKDTMLIDSAEGWSKELVGTFGLTQNHYENWAQEGENSLAWQIQVSGQLIKMGKTYNWTNNGYFALGKARIGKLSSRKTLDEIRAESIYAYLIGKKVNPYISIYGQTQTLKSFRYTDSTKYEISSFMDPGYFAQGLGGKWTIHKKFISRLGFAFKETYTDAHSIPFADNPKTSKIEKIKWEQGLEWITDAKFTLMKNLLLDSRLNIFSNFKGTEEIDVRWDNVIIGKMNTYFSSRLEFRFLYDKDLSNKVQWNESLSMTLSYSLF
jgi:hypothetical protein